MPPATRLEIVAAVTIWARQFLATADAQIAAAMAVDFTGVVASVAVAVRFVGLVVVEIDIGLVSHHPLSFHYDPLAVRVGVALRLQRDKGSVQSEQGPGQYQLWEIAR